MSSKKLRKMSSFSGMLPETELKVMRRVRDCKNDEKHPDELNLANLELTVLPSDVFSIKNLRTLNLRRNALEYLPENIDLLESLEILNVSENSLSTLPASIGKLKNLYKLQAQKNKLQWLPAEICSLINLREVYLGDNKIDELPEDIGDMESLTIFVAPRNNLKELPESFSTRNLAFLHTVNFEGNDLAFMPWNIKTLQDLFPIKTDAKKRRELVQRSLRIRAKVNERMLLEGTLDEDVVM